MKTLLVIKQALQKASGVDNPNLEFSSRSEFGDYTTNVALQSKNPKETANKILDILNNDNSLKDVVEKIDIAGPGFINFHLSTKALTTNLSQIIEQKENYGKPLHANTKTVVIDYSAPNIAKAFGIGHLRSTIIGQSLYNLYNFLGYKTIGDNHLGDWGTQFGKIIYMIDSKKLDAKKLTIKELEEIYVEFHQLEKEDSSLEDKARLWFKRLEDGDKVAKQIWEDCIATSLKEFDRIYKLLNVKIDYSLGESFYEEEMKLMLKDPKILKHITEGENGAKIIDLSKFGIKVPLMFIKSNGTTTYATRDLATIKYRVEKWNPDIIIYEVGGEQILHFNQVFSAAKVLGLVKDSVNLVHVAHGLYLAPDGKKFSTRKGKTIKLEEVLDEAIEKAAEFNKDVAKEVGIGAIKYFDLMHAPTSNIVFDWDKIFVLEGNSGPYIQYTFARTQSILDKSPKKESVDNSNLNIEELDLMRHLSKFSEIILQTAETYSPNILAEYLYNLAQKYNTYYNKHKIIGSENEEFGVALTACVGQVLKNGLTLLGIEAPVKM